MTTALQAPSSSLRRPNSRLLVPDYSATATDVQSFFERWCNFRSSYRVRHMARMVRNLHYLYDRQWIELDTEVLLDTARGYVFRDLRRSGYIDLPRPVSNYIAPAVETEMAALGKKEYKPNVIATSNHPKVIAAARLSKEILEHRMEQLHWADLRDLFTLLMVTTGTGIMRSYWDEPTSDPTLVGSPYAMACPSCPTKLASSRVPRELFEMGKQGALGSQSLLPGESPDPGTILHTELAREVPTESPEDPEEVELTHCPTCEQPTPLTPYDVSTEEASSTLDIFQRPLGLLTPRGNTALEVISPFQFFPQNGGVDITPQTMSSYAIAMPRSLDWLEDRYPDRIDEVEPEDPRELMRYHPILGEWDLLGHFSPALDSGIYDDHAMWYLFYQAPTVRFPKGRHIEYAGGALLDNDECLIPYTNHQGVQSAVWREKVSAARYKVRIGEFWGAALPDSGISPQNRINGMDAQIIEARDRMGSPNLLVPDDMDFRGPEWFDDYGSGKIMRYAPDPNVPTAKPEVFGSVLFPGGVWQERDRCLTDFQTILGPQEIEVGDVPKGLKTTSGLVLLGENANRKRAPRERASATVYEEQWTQHLQLLYALRTEEDSYEADIFEGFSRKEKRYFFGAKLMGQTQVKVSKEAAVDKGIYQREAAVEAQTDGLYLIDSAQSRKRLLELRGLPTDVNEDMNLQVECAQQQWVDYKDEGTVPIIDTTIDDPGVHFTELATRLLTDEGKELEEAVGWLTNNIPNKIAGWEEKLVQLEFQDQAARAVYGDEAAQDPALARSLFIQKVGEFQVANEAWKNQSRTASSLQVPGLAPQEALPPEPPPPLVFLPKAMEDRIYLIWLQMLGPVMSPGVVTDPAGNPAVDGMTGQPIPLPPSEELQLLDRHLRFRAVVDAYRRLNEARLAAAAMGIPTMAAPAGGATEQGTVPAPGQPMTPGGGMGASPTVSGPNA